MVRASLFVSAPDRINLVMYGPRTSFYSLDPKLGRHYQILFPADLKVDVPGGYGQYRIGSLGKLARLDKNTHLIQKTFASTTTTFIHYTFSPNTDEVFYGSQLDETTSKPSIRHILFDESNAHPLDRLYLAFGLLGENSTAFKIIRYRQDEDSVLGETVFNEETFRKNSLGLLFQSSYRDEQASVQVLYPTQYRTGSRIATVLEGNGIRVSDISLDIKRSTQCRVAYSADVPTKTARDIATYFSCPLVKEATDVYDILFAVGEREKEWEILR